jgi:hypothetical protein
MPIERYCTNTGCPGGDGCMSEYRDPSRQCVYEYVAAPKDSPEAKYNWMGEGPPPSRWVALDGTNVYRSFADSCD